MNEFTNLAEPGSLPGIGAFDDKLKKQLANTAQYTNRLFLETSPYLLQHAHNPINWYPWGEEAFKAAKKLGRPVLLSVGYSTCHWCHVMESESFENLQIAEFLNKNYIAIKVDREQRPDIDSLYMTAVQAISGQGGWPMTVWLTPEKQPFFGGTYFPPVDGMRGQVGFLTLLKNILHVFQNEPLKIHTASTDLQNIIKNTMMAQHPSNLPNQSIFEKIMAFYSTRFDEHFGGLNPAPKFPSQLSIQLLLREYQKTNDSSLLLMATRTLNQMAAGGLRDHVGGGFHRYSTDQRWLVPHFEKMLYDQALITLDYLAAYQVTKDDNYQQIIEEILTYIQREMTSPQGAFYSASDADSETLEGNIQEGYFFSWKKSELEQILDQDSVQLCNYFNVTDEGNFEGRNILHSDLLSFEPEIECLKPKLLNIRNQRPQPFVDKKIMTCWNSLMISSFAKSGFAFHRDDLVYCAIQAANHILTHLHDNTRLYRIKKTPGFLDDYAYFLAACLDLFTATQDITWIKKAIKISNTIDEVFSDTEYGGWFISSADHDPLLAREKPIYDGPIPSANAVQIMNCLRLYAITSNTKYRDHAQKALSVFADLVSENPAAYVAYCTSLDFFISNIKTIVIISPNDQNPLSNNPLIDSLRGEFLPNIVVIATNEQQTDLLEITKNKTAIDKKITAFVCTEGICSEPATTLNMTSLR